MTETVLIRPQGGDGEENDRREPFRPAPPQRRLGVGVLLRQVAGVNEDILNWVPEERPRYTRLGAIVVNTGLMAALSMLVLLGTVDVPRPLTVPVALMWGYLILSFDGWLVASTHGVQGMARLRIFVPRLMISVLMGAVIAEPLLLWVFAPAIHTEVQEQRKALVDGYESKLKACNPSTGKAPEVTGCQSYLLNVPGVPDAAREQLQKAIAERDTLQGNVNKINAELTRLNELAHDECVGKPGKGLTGRVGQGPNCLRDRTEADQYRRSSNIEQQEADLRARNNEIDQLTGAEGRTSSNYAGAVKTAVDTKVSEQRGTQGKVGILDEDKALESLASRSAFVFIGSWLLRLLLVIIDCLPVLTKLMSRNTTYDMLLGRQLAISGRLHDKHIIEREQTTGGLIDVKIQRNEHRVRIEKEEIDEASRGARANREAGLDDQIEKLAERLRNAGS